MHIIRILFLVSMIAVISGLLGWFRAAPAMMNIDTSEENWPQEMFDAPGESPSYTQSIMATLDASGFLPSYRSPTARDADGEGVSSGGGAADAERATRPALPDVLSVSFIDDKPRVHVAGEGGSIIHLRKGEVLPSGWKLERVNKQQAKFSYQDDIHLFRFAAAEPKDGE